ncbi:MAG: hypothetical protein LBL42_00720, partial [Tannerella sp.]|nr:hypothetical protein [Tannerella sp.]
PDLSPKVPDLSTEVPDLSPEVADLSPDVPELSPEVPDLSITGIKVSSLRDGTLLTAGYAALHLR